MINVAKGNSDSNDMLFLKKYFVIKCSLAHCNFFVPWERVQLHLHEPTFGI